MCSGLFSAAHSDTSESTDSTAQYSTPSSASVVSLPDPPSDMDTATNARFQSLEASVQQTTTDIADLKQMLENFIKSIPNPTTKVTADLDAPTPTNTTPPSTLSHHLKVNLPPPFDGDRSKGKAFVNACGLFMRLQPHLFPNDEVKISWIMSYMASGRAARFRDAWLKVVNTKDAQNPFPTFEAFATNHHHYD